MDSGFSDEDLDIRKLSEADFPLLKTFSCYEKELVDFLLEDAYPNQAAGISVTYLVIEKKGKCLVGYVSVLTDAINLEGELKAFFGSKDIHYKSLPALKIGRVAVDDRFQGRGAGTYIMEFTINLAHLIGENAGCRFITVDSKRNSDPGKDPIHFYKKAGFQILKERKKGTIPMYLDLRLK